MGGAQCETDEVEVLDFVGFALRSAHNDRAGPRGAKNFKNQMSDAGQPPAMHRLREGETEVGPGGRDTGALELRPLDCDIRRAVAPAALAALAMADIAADAPLLRGGGTSLPGRWPAVAAKLL